MKYWLILTGLVSWHWYYVSNFQASLFHVQSRISKVCQTYPTLHLLTKYSNYYFFPYSQPLWNPSPQTSSLRSVLYLWFLPCTLSCPSWPTRHLLSIGLCFIAPYCPPHISYTQDPPSLPHTSLHTSTPHRTSHKSSQTDDMSMSWSGQSLPYMSCPDLREGHSPWLH